MVKRRLLNEEVGELGRSDAARKRGVEAQGLGASPSEDRPPALGEGKDPVALSSRPVELQVEAQIVDDREWRPAVEIGREEGGAGDVRGVLAELRGEVVGLLEKPP